ncbi:MAG: hypothetical protein ACRDYX_18165 [Egibacteraceae bacterium]
MTPATPPSPGPRAPRLRPDERIAPYVTRLGRFRRVDPRRTRSLPSLAQVMGVLGWAVLLGESFRRAVFAARAQRAREVA